MVALVNWDDVLLIQSNQTCDGTGANYKDNRSVWHGLSDVVYLSGSWNTDAGPGTLPVGLREARKFTLLGEASFTFTGRTLVSQQPIRK